MATMHLKTKQMNKLITITKVVLVTLKVAGVLDWSWWWILSPIWVPYAAFGLILTILVIISELMDNGDE